MPTKFVTNEGGVFVPVVKVSSAEDSGDSFGTVVTVVVHEAFDASGGSPDDTDTSVVDEAFVSVVNVEEALDVVDGAEELPVIADAFVLADDAVMVRRL